MPRQRGEGSARERLLAAANELFYREGVHTVGIERVLERAGVAKASLYSTFGSKEELVRTYLEERAKARQARILDRLDRHTDPRERILAVFELQAETVADPGYRGCAFINATAEGPQGASKGTRVCVDTRAWLRELFATEASAMGVREPDRLARQLALVYDGVAVGVPLDGTPALAHDARAIAETLLEVAAR